MYVCEVIVIIHPRRCEVQSDDLVILLKLIHNVEVYYIKEESNFKKAMSWHLFTIVIDNQ